MTDQASTFEAALSAEEWNVVRALREVPSAPLRGQLSALLAELINHVRSPRCAEAQSDGVPCLTVTTACAECQRASEVLAQISRDLHHD